MNKSCLGCNYWCCPLCDATFLNNIDANGHIRPVIIRRSLCPRFQTLPQRSLLPLFNSIPLLDAFEENNRSVEAELSFESLHEEEISSIGMVKSFLSDDDEANYPILRKIRELERRQRGKNGQQILHDMRVNKKHSLPSSNNKNAKSNERPIVIQREHAFDVKGVKCLNRKRACLGLPESEKDRSCKLDHKKTDLKVLKHDIGVQVNDAKIETDPNSKQYAKYPLMQSWVRYSKEEIPQKRSLKFKNRGEVSEENSAIQRSMFMEVVRVGNEKNPFEKPIQNQRSAFESELFSDSDKSDPSHVSVRKKGYFAKPVSSNRENTDGNLKPTGSSNEEDMKHSCRSDGHSNRSFSVNKIETHSSYLNASLPLQQSVLFEDEKAKLNSLKQPQLQDKREDKFDASDGEKKNSKDTPKSGNKRQSSDSSSSDLSSETPKDARLGRAIRRTNAFRSSTFRSSTTLQRVKKNSEHKNDLCSFDNKCETFSRRLSRVVRKTYKEDEKESINSSKASHSNGDLAKSSQNKSAAPDVSGTKPTSTKTPTDPDKQNPVDLKMGKGSSDASVLNINATVNESMLRGNDKTTKTEDTTPVPKNDTPPQLIGLKTIGEEEHSTPNINTFYDKTAKSEDEKKSDTKRSESRSLHKSKSGKDSERSGENSASNEEEPLSYSKQSHLVSKNSVTSIQNEEVSQSEDEDKSDAYPSSVESNKESRSEEDNVSDDSKHSSHLEHSSKKSAKSGSNADIFDEAFVNAESLAISQNPEDGSKEQEVISSGHSSNFSAKHSDKDSSVKQSSESEHSKFEQGNNQDVEESQNPNEGLNEEAEHSEEKEDDASGTSEQ